MKRPYIFFILSQVIVLLMPLLLLIIIFILLDAVLDQALGINGDLMAFGKKVTCGRCKNYMGVLINILVYFDLCRLTKTFK